MNLSLYVVWTSSAWKINKQTNKQINKQINKQPQMLDSKGEGGGERLEPKSLPPPLVPRQQSCHCKESWQNSGSWIWNLSHPHIWAVWNWYGTEHIEVRLCFVLIWIELNWIDFIILGVPCFGLFTKDIKTFDIWIYFNYHRLIEWPILRNCKSVQYLASAVSDTWFE